MRADPRRQVSPAALRAGKLHQRGFIFCSPQSLCRVPSCSLIRSGRCIDWLCSLMDWFGGARLAWVNLNEIFRVLLLIDGVLFMFCMCRPQHLSGLQLVSDLCAGSLQGGSIGSTDVSLTPGKIRSGSHTADPQTAG